MSTETQTDPPKEAAPAPVSLESVASTLDKVCRSLDKLWSAQRQTRTELELVAERVLADGSTGSGSTGSTGGSSTGGSSTGDSKGSTNGVSNGSTQASAANVMKPMPGTTASRAYSHPILDYAAASVLFATGYLSLDRRQRRGAAYALPIIPLAVGLFEAYTQGQRGENNHDAKVGSATAAAGALGSLLIGAR